jgi:alkyl sulfatase BDS1-like metallo-beta-lactamase superfamily hydrolase
MIELPPGVARSFANRGYYGSVNHCVKAVYVYYLGWFDGNPANLHPLPPVETAKKTVEYMGGADALLARAREDLARGEYRWVAQTVNHVVFADPDNREARELQAEALRQLGYQAENGTWRNFYLSAAKELTDGVTVMPTPSSLTPDLVRALTIEMLLDFMAVRLNGPQAADRDYLFDLELTDSGEVYELEVGNGVLNYTKDSRSDSPTAVIRTTRGDLDAVIAGETDFAGAVADGRLVIEGDAAAFMDFLGLLDDFEFWFNIVTP